jgi:eukaryotic-like serine/threonine-protein kinase
MLAEGQQLSHYRLVRLLKNGGMGEVYLAVDTLLHRHVAIKVINTNELQYAETNAAKDAARLFLREAQAIAQLDHSNILPLYYSGEQIVDGISLMYMVMPYRQAGSLEDWKRSHFGNQLLPLAAVVLIVEQAALALQHAHDRQFVHQDVKPSNFLVQGSPDYPGELHLQLADFGVAKAMMMTSESQVIRGTPTYMAPEQWEGHPVPATDQYALAVMAYELLTGRPPFVGNGYQHMWHQHVHIAPSLPAKINPSLPAELDAVFFRALEKNPEKRFSSVLAFAHAFQRAVLNSGNVHQTLTITALEARTGTNRVLPLYNGRQVIVPIPPGVNHGQVIRLEGYGRPTTYNNPIGALIVTINIAPVIAVEAVSPTTSTFQHTVPVSNSLSRTEARPALPPVPLNKHLIKDHTKLRRASTALAFILILLSASMGYVAITKSSGPQIIGDPPNHPFPSYIHIHRPAKVSLALFDSLKEENKNLLWVLPPGICSFTDSALIAQITRYDTTQEHFHNCMIKTHTFTNFVYEVSMKFVSSNAGDCGGISFRNNPQTELQLYYFYICRDQHYGLIRYMDNDDPPKDLLPPGATSNLIPQGPGQTYILAVVVQKFNFELYVNHQYIASVTDLDQSFKNGTIGVLVRSFDIGTTEVAFSDATVWTL